MQFYIGCLPNRIKKSIDYIVNGSKEVLKTINAYIHCNPTDCYMNILFINYLPEFLV